MNWGGSRTLQNIGLEMLKNSTINPMTETRAGNWGKAIGTGLETSINRNRNLAMMQSLMGQPSPAAPNKVGGKAPDGQPPMPGAAPSSGSSQAVIPPAIQKMAQMQAAMDDFPGAMKTLSDFRSAAALKAIPQNPGEKNQVVTLQDGTRVILDLNKYTGTEFPAGLKPNEFLNVAGDWDRVKAPVWEAVQSYETVRKLLEEGQAGIIDYGILIKAIKALDPSSAVMAGEAEAAQKMTALADKMAGQYKLVLEGGFGAEAARQQLAKLAEIAAKTALEVYEKKRSGKRDAYTEAGMSPGQIDAILQPIKTDWWKPKGAATKPDAPAAIGNPMTRGKQLQDQYGVN